jgi:hypothetical protein
MSDQRIDARLLDAMFNSYIDWFDECQQVRLAYRRWRSAGRGDAAGAFAGYAAALDREESASKVYARHVTSASRFVTRNLPVATPGDAAAAAS